ncbi:hemicentin-2-like isoform X1 [Diachasmimorpha longicaudata]|uniref:hemicentin-2-like isoform X1 n=1 Tax=Diachasmimorpha longicaudata TaxID=58733 RepID=UPI0030B8B57F
MKWCIAVIYVLGVVGGRGQELQDLDKPVPIADVYGVAGHKAQLPCNILTRRNDRVDMVLWFKGEGGPPIYTVDVRHKQFSNAELWSSPRVLGARAYFMTAAHPAHLSIDKLKTGDGGLYRCRVDYSNSPTAIHHVNLIVIVPPEKPVIRHQSSGNISHMEETYNEGSDVTLICEARGGRPPPRLTWYYENNVYDLSYEYNSTTDMTTNLLYYPNIGRQHIKTRLVCQANNTNIVPPLTKLVILDVNMKPLLVKIITKEDKVSSGKKYAVECRSWGSKPPAAMTWWKDSRQITDVIQNYQPENNQSISILEFVPSIEDDGKYLTCRAENPSIPDSIVEDKWVLDVQHQPVVSLRMGVTLNPHGIKEGDDVYFECIVRANPRVYKLAWFKDEKELKNNATAGVVRSDRSLILQGITRGAAGDYKCLAANSEGKTASNTVKLEVMFVPVCKEGKSGIVVGALKQETVSLICAVESHPVPLTYQWTFNNSGELVDLLHSRSHALGSSNSQNPAESLKEYQQYHGSRLNYTPATDKDYGTLACRATNVLGRQLTPCLFQVISAGRPHALHNCTASEMSNSIEIDDYIGKSGSGLTVHCLEDYQGGLPIESYQLEVVGEEDDGEILLNRTVPAGPNGPVFEVAGLTAGRSYRLFLYAVNSKGRSEPTILEPVTLKGVAMYTTGNTDASVLSPLLLGLTAIATLLALAVAGILAALYRKHSGGRNGSPKHAPIVCEAPNTGATTPVHPSNKQAVDDIDPDIIPNEYERRPLTYTPVYKTPPQRRRKERDMDDGTSLEKKPIVEASMDIHCDTDVRLMDGSLSSTINYPQNHVVHQNTYSQAPTMADFKQMAMDAYNQRNHQNVYYSLQRSSKGLGPISQRPVSSSLSAHGKFHQPEVVTRSNRIQESCI